MRTQLLTYAIFLLSFFSIQSQTSKKVLFIGNSYTGANNLPLMVSNMATNTGDALIYDSNTPGGFRLINHASNATTLNKINANTWDYVVLQGQSQETSWSESQMERELYPYAESLTNAIRANNACSEPLFYMTWGRENGDASNCASAPWVCTYEGMDNVINATYTYMADVNNGAVAPAGAVWRYIRTNYPTTNLYSSDGSHPSVAGSYAVACAFYSMIYKKDPTQITWNSSLSESDANAIKLAAKLVVFDAISDWDFTLNPASADFSEVVNTNTITLTNTSSDFESLLWDFGDGNTSTEINPIHTYTTTGNFTVSLTVTACSKFDVKTKIINITNLSLDEFDIRDVHVFPNPVTQNLTLSLPKNYQDIQIQIFDISGKPVFQNQAQLVKNLELNLTTLSPGIYIMKLVADEKTYTSKIVKI